MTITLHYKINLSLILLTPFLIIASTGAMISCGYKNYKITLATCEISNKKRTLPHLQLDCYHLRKCLWDNHCTPTP